MGRDWSKGLTKANSLGVARIAEKARLRHVLGLTPVTFTTKGRHLSDADKKRLTGRIPRDCPYATREQFYHFYWVDEMSIMEIEKMIGHRNIQYWFDKYKIPKRGVKEALRLVSSKRSAITRNLWKVPEYRDKVVERTRKANHKRPTRPEVSLLSLLNEVCPGQYVYTGDGGVVMDGLCPDFSNVNGQKKLIEMFGDYWHKEGEVEERKKRFLKFGFDCLIIWESELRDKEKVISVLRNFNG